MLWISVQHSGILSLLVKMKTIGAESRSTHQIAVSADLFGCKNLT